MEKMGEKKGLLIVFLFMILILGIGLLDAENLNLKITGTVNNISSHVYLKTNPNAVNGTDSYDMFVQNLPSGDYSSFYSNVSSSGLSIDSWNWVTDRLINLVFQVSAPQTGALTFSWVPLTGTFDGSFIYYGSDSSYTNVVGNTSLRNNSSYTVNINGDTNLYARAAITSYVAALSCPDGSCNNGETCSSCPADCGVCSPNPPGGPGGGGGGGGGGGASSNKTAQSTKFSIDKDLVQVTLVKGEATKQSFVIKNTDTKTKSFDISLVGDLKNLLFLSDESITLDPGEEKTIYLTFVSPEGVDAGVYNGNIKVISGSSEKEVLIVITVKNKKSLFDVSVKVPSNYKQLSSGSDLFFEISLFNLGQTGRIDAFVEYFIKDFDGNVLEKKDETVAVETQASFLRSIKLPDDVKSGKYLVVTNIKYGNNTEASSSDTFEVGSKNLIGFSIPPKILIWIIIGIVFVIIVIIVVYLIYKKNRKMKLKKLFNNSASSN
jgi:hypothetical protein